MTIASSQARAFTPRAPGSPWRSAVGLTPAAVTALLLAGCGGGDAVHAPASPESSYIFAWAADADAAESDFLSVIDATPGHAGYGQIVATLPVGMSATMAHHTEPEMPTDGFLLANGFDANTTFRFDLRDPLQPRLASTLPLPPPYEHAHSLLRLADGRVLVTYQYQGAQHALAGGLVEYAPDGRVLKTGSAIDPASTEFVRPYSVAAAPALDLAITSGHDMHGGGVSRVVQIWRLSDLSLRSTVVLPTGPRGTEHVSSYEPRFVGGGTAALVSTRSCGLYRIDQLETGNPTAVLVYTFDDTRCFVPVVIGDYWLQALGHTPIVVVLDVSDPDHPREVSRLRLLDGDVPHWLAASEDGRRVVITGFNGLERRLLLALFDPATGVLQVDERFGAGGLAGVSFDRADWPHGASGPAIPHGSVFSRRGTSSHP